MDLNSSIEESRSGLGVRMNLLELYPPGPFLGTGLEIPFAPISIRVSKAPRFRGIRYIC